MFCSLITEKRKQKFIILISHFCQWSNKALEEFRHSGVPGECQRNDITPNGKGNMAEIYFYSLYVICAKD